MSQRETARGSAYPYLDHTQPQPSAPPPPPSRAIQESKNDSGSHSTQPSQAASSTSRLPSSSTTSPWMSLEAASRNDRADSAYPSLAPSPSPPAPAASTSSDSNSSTTSIPAPSLPPLPSFAQSPAKRALPSAPLPELYAPQLMRASPLDVAATAASIAAASVLTRAASALHSALPHTRPSTAMQIIDAYHAARRHKTLQRYAYAVSMLVAALLLALCSLLVDAPAAVLAVCDVLHMRPALLRWPLWLLCAGAWVAGCVGLYRYYAPLPSLQGVSHRQRKLMGVPYDADLLAQEAIAVPPRATVIAAEGLRKRHALAQAALSSLAEEAMPTSTSTATRRPLPASTSPFPSLSSSSFITPTKGGWPSYGDAAMTDAKELHRFIAAAEQPPPVQTPPPLSASSFYSPYRSPGALGGYGGGMSHTPPYATSVRTTSTLVRGGSTHSGGMRSGRYALDDPRADSESSERANELFIELGISNAIDVWSRNMKQWLHTVVLQPLARDLESSRQELTSLASLVLQSAAPTQLRDDERSLLRSIDRSPTVAFDFLLDRFPSRPECERWRQLTKYIRIGPSPSSSSTPSPSFPHNPQPQPSSSHYTFQRLFQLGQRDGLSLYQWNAGSPSWSPPLPSDAAVVCHAFWAFLSDFHPLVVQTHFMDEGAGVGGGEGVRGRGRKAGVVMHQCRPWSLPPYYLLMVEVDSPAAGGSKVGGEEVREWRCEPGRSNLFQALALLVWHIKTQAGGRIGSIRLKDRALDNLDHVVD